MTYAEIKAMKQEIAAKVMGYTKANYGDGSGEYWQNADEKWMCWVGSEPEWPTDFGMALQVIQAMRNKGFDNQFAWRADRPGHRERPFAAFGRYGGVSADTLAEAICRAALEVYGGH